MKYLVILDDEIDFVMKCGKCGSETVCIDTWVEAPNFTKLNSASEADARKIIEGMKSK